MLKRITFGDIASCLEYIIHNVLDEDNEIFDIFEFIEFLEENDEEFIEIKNF